MILLGVSYWSASDLLIQDPANDLQAMDRAFRIGQKRPVDVYRLIGRGTIEELTYERQSESSGVKWTDDSIQAATRSATERRDV